MSRRVFARAAVAAAVLAGAACSKLDPMVDAPVASRHGEWRVERTVDRVTGAAVPSAVVRATDTSNSEKAFPAKAGLQLTCFRSRPVVRLGFDFRVGSTNNSTLGYRFDAKPGREVEARILQDFRTVMIEDARDVATFVRELAGSQVLYMRIRSLNAGRTSAEFNVDGAPAAVEAVLADCPLPPAQPPRAPARVSARRTGGNGSGVAAPR